MTFESPALFWETTPDVVVYRPVSEECEGIDFKNIRKEPNGYLHRQKKYLIGVGRFS